MSILFYYKIHLHDSLLVIHNINKYYFNLSNMNKKFMFSIALLMSIVLGSGFTVANQTAMAAVITYPNTNTLYDNAYSSSNDKYSSNYGESEYDYDYYPSYNNNDNNNNDNNNTYTNDDKYSSNYGESEYDYAYYPSYNKDDNNNNTYTNTDKYSDSYSKPSNTYNNNNYNNNDYNNKNKNNNDSYESTDYKYSDSYSNSDGYSKYPTNDKLYECQKGPLEGFFTSSVEFCIAANSNTK